MADLLLLDLTHTSHTSARTGIQRVACNLWQCLAGSAISITRDQFLGGWRALEPWELTHLSNGRKRVRRWPQLAKWRGRWRRATKRAPKHMLAGEFAGLIEPEIFSPLVARDLPRISAHVRGPRIALFHDAIPLRFPELTPPKIVARFPGYLLELSSFDGVAAMSEESRESLVGYWAWLGIEDAPPVAVIPLGVDSPQCHRLDDIARRAVDTGPPVVLSVGTLEGRKNHLALLEACEQLWERGANFQLRLIGHVNAETGGGALARVRALQSAGRPLRYDGPATDEEIARAYAECAFTIYPSIAEGFGLPVIESLARGKPCICSSRGALGEISRDGGCLALDNLEAASLATAIARLIESPAELSVLVSVAQARTFKTWGDYAQELTAWMRTLPCR